MDPSDRLAGHLVTRGAVAALARQLGCDPSYLTHICAGRRKPGRRLAAALEAASAAWPGGPITVASWDAPQRRRQRPAGEAA